MTESYGTTVDVGPIPQCHRVGASMLHAPGHGDSGKGFVHLEQIDVVNGETGAIERLLRCGYRSGEHDHRIDAGHGHGVNPCFRLEPEFFGLLLRHQEQRCGPIGDLGRVAGGDPAIALERRLKGCQLLQRGVPPDTFVSRDDFGASVVPGDFYRNDLALESTLFGGLAGPSMRLERQLVELLAGDPPLVGDHLGGDALRDQTVGVPLQHLCPERETGTLLSSDPHRNPGHVLDTRRNDDVLDSGHDRLGRKVDRLL